MSVPIRSQDRDVADAIWTQYRDKSTLARRQTPGTAAGRWHWLALALMTALAGALLLLLVPPGPLVYALAAAACGATAHALWRCFGPSRVPRAVSPVIILSTPPVDPVEAALEARLLELCQQDRQVFNRLVGHERARQPTAHRVEQLRLAINHFERDKA